MSRARSLSSVLPRLALVVACLSLSGPPEAHAAGACFEDWWQERLGAARAEIDSPAALLPLREVLDAAFTAEDPRHVATSLEELRTAQGVDPLVAAEIDHALLTFELRGANLAAAAKRRERLGMVEQWMVAGPLEDDSRTLALLDELGRVDGPWRSASVDPTGVLPLHYAMYPQNERVALAAFYLRAQRATTVALRFGADDRAEVRLDGRTVFSRPDRHEMAFDQDSVLLYLEEGLHRVSFLVEQQTSAWLLRARLSSPAGDPLGAHVRIVRDADPGLLERELERALAERGSQSGARRERFERKLRRRDGELRSVTAVLESRAKRGTPRDRAAFALDLARRNLPSRDDSRALALARQAATAAPGDPVVEWVASAIEIDPSRRRAALERILEKDPQQAVALRLLTGYHLSFSDNAAALDYASRALRACPAGDPYLEAQEALAIDGGRFALGALAGIERALKKAPDQPLLLRRVAELARAEGMRLRARQALEALAALDIADAEARAFLVMALSEAGRRDALVRILEQARLLEPTNPAPTLRLARVYVAEGNAEKALELIEEGLRRASGNPDLLGAKGEALLALGNDVGAADAWRAVLEQVGDDEGLSRRIAHLEGEARGSSEWRVPIDEALAIEEAAELEGDPPFVVLSSTSAFRVQPNGLASRYHQVVMRVRHAERSSSARSYQVSFSPSMQEVQIHDARIIRSDGTVLLASRRTRHLLPDVELRMWYDTRVLSLSFPRLEDGDLIDIRYDVTDRGQRNPIGEGYFGAIELLGRPVPVLSARMVLDAPKELPLFHSFVHLDEVRESPLAREGRNVRVFEIAALPAFKDAPLAPPPTERIPYVVVSSVDDWSRLGRIYADLIRDQLASTPDLKELVASLTRGASGRRDTVRRLYDWVIDNTRYVALEFGIHALKPYPVRSVLQRRHGDCKDKASLLVAMLHEAGIESKVTLLRTSMRGDIETSIPAFSIFDHAIVYVPGEELWLDGTVLHHGLGETPFADLGTLALPVDPFGDKAWPLMRTPEPSPRGAARVEEQVLTLDAKGGALIESAVAATGEFAAIERYYFRGKDQPLRILSNRLQGAFPDLRVLGADFRELGLGAERVEYNWKGEKARFGRSESERLSLPMGLDVPSLGLEEPSPEREIAIRLPDAFTRRLESRIVAPEGFEIVEFPRNVETSSDWGLVRVDCRKTRRGLDITVEVTLNGGRVPVERISEFRGFLLEAREALEQRVILEERG